MSDAIVFKIESGALGLALVDKSAIGYSDDWQAPGGKNVDEVVIADYPDSAGFACQITSGTVTSSANTTTKTRAATWCAASVTVTETGQSSYGFDAAFFQDPQVAAGISRFLFENDARECYVFVGLDGLNPPRAIGRVDLVAGAFAGAGRTELTATVTLPFKRKPTIEFGDASESVIINAPGLDAGAAAPDDAFDREPTITASDSTNAAKLAGLGYVALPQTAWTIGQSMTVGGIEFYWDGSAWAAGASPGGS